MNGKELLYLQIFFILVLFYFGSTEVIISNPILLIIFIVAMILGLWAFYNMGSKTYSPFPHPRQGGKLTQEGAYKFIRHPMYTAVIMLGLTLFLSAPSFTSFLVFLMLVGVLHIKVDLEEELLSKMHKGYKDYAQKTKKFIPFIY